MKVSIHQPNFLPYLGFFNKVAQSDLFVVYDVAQYVRDRFDNRNQIKGPNGPVWLTVPVQVKDSFKKRFHEVMLPLDDTWRMKHLKSIKMAYARAPYFSTYFGELERIYLAPGDRLAELSIALIELMMDGLGIRTKMVRTTSLNLDLDLQSSEMIVQILRRVGADSYLAGRSGRNYMDLPLFEREGIAVEFQEFSHPRYRQLFGEFVPNLSAIDLLLNEGENAGRLVAGAA
jgi:hypothetical protein